MLGFGNRNLEYWRTEGSQGPPGRAEALDLLAPDGKDPTIRRRLAITSEKNQEAKETEGKKGGGTLGSHRGKNKEEEDPPGATQKETR